MMTSKRLLFAGAVLVAVVAPVQDARAQGAGAQAEILFREGRELMTAGKFAEACASFEKSQQLEPAISTLLNLAGCRERNQQLATAWGLFLDAERKTRNATDATGRKFHAVAKKRASELEAKVSKLTIKVADNTIPGLEVSRDTERLDAVMWNRALPIDGGTYTITARATGTKAWTMKVTIAPERDSRTVEVPDPRKAAGPLDPEPVATTPPVTAPVGTSPPVPVTPSDRGASSGSGRTLAIVLGVGGVVVLGSALGAELWARSTYSDAKAELVDQGRRDSLYDSANTKRYAAQGLAVAGVGLVGVAVWLFVRGGDSDRAEATSSLVISPSGMAFAGSF
jgi:hypothetical protein